MVGVKMRDENEFDAGQDGVELIHSEPTRELAERALAAVEEDVAEPGDGEKRGADWKSSKEKLVS